jgi:site-specific recombinase XerD
MTDAGNSTTFLECNDHSAWVAVYSEACLSQKNPGTIDVYQRVLRDFFLWLAKFVGSSPVPFHQLTRTTVEMYLDALEETGYSVSHRVRVKSVLSSFCQWLIDEQGILKRNPARNLELPAQQVLAPRILSEKQRIILRILVEQAEDLRGEALFALGYWAGCRVSDVAHLLLEYTHVGPKIGWLHVGHKGGKFRDIDLLNQARRPLFEYLQHGGRDPGSPYIFTSQRNQQLTEAEFIIGFVCSNSELHQISGRKLLISRFMICVMILRIGHEKLAGPWKRLPIIWDMSPKKEHLPSKRRQGTLRSAESR